MVSDIFAKLEQVILGTGHIVFTITELCLSWVNQIRKVRSGCWVLPCS